MESNQKFINLEEPTQLMTLSPHSPCLSLGAISGNLIYVDLNACSIKSRTAIFNCQIECIRNTGQSEVLVSSRNREVFYGRIDAQGQKEGISFSTKGDCLSIDISDFMVAVGSEDGEICTKIF